MKIDETVALVKKFFVENDWNFEFNEKNNAFTGGISLRNQVIGSCRFVLLVRDNDILCYTIINTTAKEQCIHKVSEFLHRANYGLNFGNFEIDFNDGEIRYKTMLLPFDLTKDLKDSMGKLVALPAAMFDRYGDGLLGVIMGLVEPKEAIEKIEK